jgi:hypothetical protein
MFEIAINARFGSRATEIAIPRFRRLSLAKPDVIVCRQSAAIVEKRRLAAPKFSGPLRKNRKTARPRKATPERSVSRPASFASYSISSKYVVGNRSGSRAIRSGAN